MSKLSISKAWEETTRVVTHDGKLITSVALALIVLPQTISGVIAPPPTLSGANPPSWMPIVMLIVGILSIAGEIAIMRLALGRTSVGEAIAHGARRIGPAFAALVLVVLALGIVLIPVMVLMAGSAGLESLATDKPTPDAGKAVLVALIMCLFAAPRFQLVIPAAAGEGGGPIHLIKRGWQLADGVYWKLFGFLVLTLIAAIVVVLFVGQIMVGILVHTMLGTIHPYSIGALISALLTSAVSAAFAATFSVILARIYVQLSGRKASAPSSGT
ncbi:MAG TPA: hypothetical protein VF067_04675 [Sphingomicrobium sp.]